jgi:hypothetical protein
MTPKSFSPVDAWVTTPLTVACCAMDGQAKITAKKIMYNGLRINRYFLNYFCPKYTTNRF